METAGHIIGYIAIVEGSLVFLSTKRGRILILKLISEILWILNMAFLGLYTGVVLNAINIVRTCVFYQRGKHKWADHLVWFWIFLCAALISPIVTWAGWISLVPVGGSICSVIGYYSKSPRLIRYMAFPSTTAWLLYAVLTQNNSSVICNCLMLLSALIGTLRQNYLERRQVSQ